MIKSSQQPELTKFPKGGTICKYCVVAAFLLECCAENGREVAHAAGESMRKSPMIPATDLYESFAAWMESHAVMPGRIAYSHKKFALIMQGGFGYRAKRAGGPRATCYYAVELSGLRQEVETHMNAHKDITAVFEAARGRQEEAS